MSSNKISEIEKIAILSTLVQKYSNESKIVNAIRIAKDLARVIDELNSSNVNLSKLTEEFINFFPEHWKKRTQFLLIVTKYWNEILKEMEKDDARIPRGRSVVSSTIVPHCAPSSSHFKKSSLIINKNTYDEIETILDIIRHHPNEKISIVSPNKDISRYLMMRLDLDGIKYTSRISYTTSPKFLSNLRQNFQNCSEVELRQIAYELSEFQEFESQECDIQILSLEEIIIIPNGIVIYSSLDENDWSIKVPGAFWLHHSLRKKLDLDSNHIEIENLFYLGIEKSSITYLLYTENIFGQLARKSSLLSMFEAQAKKANQPLKISKNKREDFSNIEISPCFISSNHFKLPLEESAKGIELLMKDPQGFYAKKILNLTPKPINERQQNIRNAFVSLARNYFEGRPIEFALDLLKESDLFAYQKALSLIEFFEKEKRDSPTHNNIKGQIRMPQFDMNLFGYADRIVEENKDALLISFQFSSNHSIKDILYGNDSELIANCLIAEERGFKDLHKPIRKIQIWNLFAPEVSQIISKEIEISGAVINDFKERLETTIEKYKNCKNPGIDCFQRQKTMYNKYIHFKRM